jgi:hypothetical protein
VVAEEVTKIRTGLELKAKEEERLALEKKAAEAKASAKPIDLLSKLQNVS